MGIGLPDEKFVLAWDANSGNRRELAEALGMWRDSIRRRQQSLNRGGDWSLLDNLRPVWVGKGDPPTWWGGDVVAAEVAGRPQDAKIVDGLRAALRKRGLTLEEAAKSLECTRGAVLDAIDALRATGVNVCQLGEAYSIESRPAPHIHSDALHLFAADADGHYRFGAVADSHLCSKYAREDALAEIYDWFAAEGITRVYHCGNWIDGEADFNRFDLEVHGMTPQVAYFVERYPRRPGITTYFIAGDDHEGWYAKRHGVDIGKMAELAAREAGRTDLVYIGYMEAFITLRHPTGAENRMLVMHPGGGSAYATSYAPQKIVESFQGGEKPAVLLLGHYHKAEWLQYREVQILQVPSTQDQTPFMRKKRIDSRIGGAIVDMWQDERGAIRRFRPEMRAFFDRGYHNGRFSPYGEVTQPCTPTP